jgi:tetratricopeptide (TPR) repeat protein
VEDSGIVSHARCNVVGCGCRIARERSKAETEKAKEAAATFEAALKENSEDLQALEGAGVTYAELGDYEKAIAKLKKLASAKPDDVDVLRLLVSPSSMIACQPLSNWRARACVCVFVCVELCVCVWVGVYDCVC